VSARTQAEVEHERALRQARQAEAQAWTAFLERARARKISLQDDARYLRSWRIWPWGAAVKVS